MKYLVCNLKNKMSLSDFNKYNNELKEIKASNINLVIAFSNIYLGMVNKGKYDLAAQDISSIIDEAVTGELTGEQLSSMGVKYVLVGHSERRIFKKEINIDFINKITAALDNGLKVIYCIGESLKEKENGLTNKVIMQQLSEVLNNVELNNIIIAYEPVWAIGTGMMPTAIEIENNVKFIKETLKNNYEMDFKVLYGGSVNKDNIAELTKIANLDGFLVGGASLNVTNVQEMLDIMAR